MLKIYFAVCSLLVGTVLSCQNDVKPTVDTPDSCKCANDGVFSFAEEMPKFIGGEGAFQIYLQQNIVYPDTAIKSKQEGTVYVTFVVDRYGRVCNAKLAKGIPRAPSLNQEALRVMRDSPDWEPGKMNGRAVCVTLTVPIKFKLK